MPTLESGQFVLYEPGGRFGVGDVVVARHPSRSIEIVKRVIEVDAEGLVELRSDNEAEGTDSRSFGSLPADAVSGVVTVSLDWPFVSVR